MVRMPEFNPYQYLAYRRFPKAFPFGNLAPSDLAGKRARDRQMAEAAAYIKELKTKTPSELSALVAEERKKEAEEEEAKRFFNWPQVRADFSHWSKASYWRLEEAIALSFGKDPRQVNWKSIEAHLAVSPFVRRYRDVRDLATRAKAMKQLYDPVLPGFFIAWANRIGCEIDPKLSELVTANGGIIADWKTKYDNEKAAHEDLQRLLAEKVKEVLADSKKQHAETLAWAKEQHARALQIGKDAVAERDKLITELQEAIQSAQKSQKAAPDSKSRTLGVRERESMLKLIIGMAKDKYGYNPDVSKSPTTRRIFDALARLGIDLDEDTIRKYLRESGDLLPRDKTE